MHFSRLARLGLMAALVAGSSVHAQQVPPAPRAPAVPPSDAAQLTALDRKILTDAKSSSEIMSNLAYLSDVIGPRLTGSTALKEANDWTAAKMRGYGLSNVHLEAWTIPAAWERGPATVRFVEPKNGRFLSAASLAWTPGTKGKIVANVVAIKAQNGKDLAVYKGKLKGAVVLTSPPESVGKVTDDPFSGLWMGQGNTPRPQGSTRVRMAGFSRNRAFRGELTEFLRTEGAAAVISDSGKPHGLLTTGGSWQGLDRANAAEPLPSLMMSHEHYALLHRLASRPAPAQTRVEIDVQNKIIPGPVAVYNTIGEIRGSEKPEEYVVIGAHLDSWDLGQGSTDNGTGSMVVLEAARLISRSGVQPKRTIRFVLFSGEEQGLRGSQAYVRQHKDEMARTSMCLVHDTGTGRVTGIGLQGRKYLKPILDAELPALKELRVEIDARAMFGSDHMSFEQSGVPGFAVQQDMTEYYLSHHTQTDTFDKAREPDLIQGAQVMALVGLHVANMPGLLPRKAATTGEAR